MKENDLFCNLGTIFTGFMLYKGTAFPAILAHRKLNKNLKIKIP